MRSLLALALLGACAAFSSAQEASFDLRPSTTSMQLGEPFIIEASVSGQTLTLDAAASSTDTYRVIGLHAPAADRFTIQVIPLAVGRIPVVLSWKAAGAEKAIQSPPVVIEASEPPLGPEPQLLDIKEPRAARRALWPWLLAAALLALAYAAYRHFSRKAAAAPAALEPRDDRTPQVRAREALAQLEASGLWEEHRRKEFYIQLTDILRQYLDGRFAMGATHLTTYELSRQMRQAEIDRRAAATIKDIFDRADLVKFAKTKPDEESGPRDIALARDVVAQTEPQDIAAAAPSSP